MLKRGVGSLSFHIMNESIGSEFEVLMVVDQVTAMND